MARLTKETMAQFQAVVASALPDAQARGRIALAGNVWITPVLRASGELMALQLEAASCPWGYERPRRRVALKDGAVNAVQLAEALADVAARSKADWAKTREASHA